MKHRANLAASLLLLIVSQTSYALEPAARCEAQKNGAAGKYWLCLQLAYAKAAKLGTPPEFESCGAALEKKWSSFETKAGGSCPTSGDRDDIQSFLTSQSQAVASALHGAGAPRCGDGMVNLPGEHCDGSSLDGHTCMTLGHDGGTLACDASCDFDASACTVNTPTCGDGAVNYVAEECDGDDLSGSSCASLGYLGGSLDCDGACHLDESACYPCTGATYAGACWYLGQAGQSCEQACSSHGLTYADATRTVVGSAGTNAACKDVIGLVTTPVASVRDSAGCGIGLGCHVDGSPEGGRCTSGVTTAEASFSVISRVCACN